MTWFCRNMQPHVRRHLLSTVVKADDPPEPPAIDTALEPRLQDEIVEADRRLRIYKSERGGDHVDLGTLYISGVRKGETASSDTIDASMPVKVLAFRVTFPAMAANARNPSDLERMAALMWPTFDPKQQARFRAQEPNIARPSNAGSTPITDPGLARSISAFGASLENAKSILADMLGEGAVSKDDDSTELDTSMRSIDDWHRRRQELRRKADNRTTVIKGDASGQPASATVVRKGEVVVKGRRLYDTDVEFVSLVDRGASRIPFRIQKRQAGLPDLSKIFERRASWARA